jgi:hypothetical protein
MKTKKSLFEQNGAHIRRLAMCSFQTYLSERWNRDLSGNMYSFSRHTTTVRTVRYTAVQPHRCRDSYRPDTVVSGLYGFCWIWSFTQVSSLDLLQIKAERV